MIRCGTWNKWNSQQIIFRSFTLCYYLREKWFVFISPSQMQVCPLHSCSSFSMEHRRSCLIWPLESDSRYQEAFILFFTSLSSLKYWWLQFWLCWVSVLSLGYTTSLEVTFLYVRCFRNWSGWFKEGWGIFIWRHLKIAWVTTGWIWFIGRSALSQWHIEFSGSEVWHRKVHTNFFFIKRLRWALRLTLEAWKKSCTTLKIWILSFTLSKIGP